MTASPTSGLDFAPYGIDTLWLDRAPRPRTILIAYPHPDDESFGNGGMIARYTAQGVAVHYACATRGECGTVDAPMLEGYADIAELRTAEQTCAAKALNLAAVHFLGYRDSGMPGTPDNLHPNAFMRVPLERVTGQLVALIRALRPQVVLTFNSYGGYGHPDHIHIHHATHAAFVAAGDPARYPEQIAAGLAPWQPSKLRAVQWPPAALPIAPISWRRALHQGCAGMGWRRARTRPVCGDIATEITYNLRVSVPSVRSLAKAVLSPSGSAHAGGISSSLNGLPRYKMLKGFAPLIRTPLERRPTTKTPTACRCRAGYDYGEENPVRLDASGKVACLGRGSYAPDPFPLFSVCSDAKCSISSRWTKMYPPPTLRRKIRSAQ